MANDAITIDDGGFRYAVYAPVYSGLTFRIVGTRGIGIAEALQPGEGVAPLVLVVDAVNGDDVLLGELQQHRMLFPAGRAPGCPDVHQAHLAFEIVGAQ